MSGESSTAAWPSLLTPVRPEAEYVRRADDPRLGEILEQWKGDAAALRAGRAVLIGFPQDEGVRRNHGRPGAAEAPDHIRQRLYRLTPTDPQHNIDLSANPPLDLGNVRITGDLEESQQALGQVVAAVLQAGAVPIVLGGGHETAYGHFLGYAHLGRPVGIINIDAHLDVRPRIDGRGHSGSPFRQALDHASHPLSGDQYVCLGAQPAAVSRQHLQVVRSRGGRVAWAAELQDHLSSYFQREQARLAAAGCSTYLTIDADAVRTADVPGVSAPNPLGLSGAEVASCARLAGRAPGVASLDVVEINPRFDRDDQSCRWAALVVWHFLAGLAARPA
jgi:formiminoglutamase